MQKVVFLIFLFITITACSASPTVNINSSTPSLTITITDTVTLTPTATGSPEPIPLLIDPDLPGVNPERFGERFFSGEFHSAPVFSPDGNTVWWAGEYGSATIYTSQLIDGTWTEPTIKSFSESIASYRDPFISPDGEKFYFISEAPTAEGLPGGKENIWMMTKEGNGWSEPQPLPLPINELALHWTVSVAENYNLYFSANQNDNTDIFLSRYVNGAYTNPIQLDTPINTSDIEVTPNIAPDESYLLFTRIASRTDPPHLYITYALESGWSEPIWVENISYCISPIITPDRSYVIYLSSPASFEWRDTSFIEALRP